MGAHLSGDVVRAFVSGIDLAVAAARGTSPLSEDDHRRIASLPDGDCLESMQELEPLLVALLTALRDDRRPDEGDQDDDRSPGVLRTPL